MLDIDTKPFYVVEDNVEAGVFHQAYNTLLLALHYTCKKAFFLFSMP